MQFKKSFKEIRAHEHRVQKKLKVISETQPVFVSYVQNEISGEVMGVLIHRNAYDKFRSNYKGDQKDFDHARLVDIELTVI